MKVSTENDNNFDYEKITILVDNMPLKLGIYIYTKLIALRYLVCYRFVSIKVNQCVNLK